MLLSIRDYFRATGADSVAALGAAATNSSNPNNAFREAAGHALAAIHTSAALPFLATLLDDSDLNLRVEAVGGMGAFANGLPTQTKAGVPSLSYLQLPASAPYKTAATAANLAFGVQAVTANEASYLLFWKSWWSQNRGSMGY
ncbi:MAG: HEAT repeat domain-containing protein [Bryobacteraceae bacterium]